MSQHDDYVNLRHMLDHATEAVALLQGITRADLDKDRVLSLALVRLLEIVGEAANRVTAATQSEYPLIPWRQLIGLRNRLIHGYDAVDMDILWTILTVDLPALVQQLERAITQQRPPGP
ncbi:MAG: DUF86 domain-containing protein [Chloroflexi bacterium]|nr:DUF86 domain-containing protein [Chloroflexota bacterium]